MRQELTTLANKLRSTGLSLSQAFKKAWSIIRLKIKMLTEEVSFTYKKEDGTTREARGYFGAAPASDKPSTKPSPILVVKYFDTIANGWRSFRADRFISIA